MKKFAVLAGVVALALLALAPTSDAKDVPLGVRFDLVSPDGGILTLIGAAGLQVEAHDSVGNLVFLDFIKANGYRAFVALPQLKELEVERPLLHVFLSDGRCVEIDRDGDWFWD